MTRYTVVGEPRGAEYAALLRAARRWCDTALLVVRDQLPVNAAGDAFLRRLAALSPRTRRADRWPGTLLLDSAATVHEVPLDEAAAELLGEAGGLFGWRQPDLPEDLCLLRARGTPWLVTIAHEADAYVDLEPAELDPLRDALPAFVARLRAEDPREVTT